jgi:hypothetical protein
MSAGNGQVYRSQFLDNGQYGIEGRAFTDLVIDTFTEGNGTAGIRDTASAMAVGRSQLLDGVSLLSAAELVDCILDVFTQVCP